MVRFASHEVASRSRRAMRDSQSGAGSQVGEYGIHLVCSGSRSSTCCEYVLVRQPSPSPIAARGRTAHQESRFSERVAHQRRIHRCQLRMQVSARVQAPSA